MNQKNIGRDIGEKIDALFTDDRLQARVMCEDSNGL